METNPISLSNKTVIIPFSFSNTPLKKLALINFEKNPDSEYLALEPQYFEDKNFGKAFRVIAYRRDGYVDVYDDENLTDDKDDTFDVTGKGLCESKKVVMKNTRFEKVNGNVFISFQFIDKYGREIVATIKEQTSKKTNGLQLLAPVGSSTENPSYLPLFFLYDFDFVRKQHTKVDVTIDGKTVTPDNFPYPLAKDFQVRYYTRYSDDCQIIEFANATSGILQEYTPDANGTFVRNSLEHTFADDRALLKVVLKNTNHPFTMEFTSGFPDVRSREDLSNYTDTFKLSAGDTMGFVAGEYTVKREVHNVHIELVPSGGWTPVPDSLFTKMMFGKKSLFCTWPKTYKYIQTININTLESTSHWERMK
ncbi:hypothetical protein ACM26V_03865 [Salipaludibacillus sp. HK11]|uniref:hypothetical protein n=1 Tax=Salipaludibacillus sp. HK11 TaxID=3394320 RepID=UPI0039FBF3C9